MEDTLICDVASRTVEAIVAEMAIHAAANVKLFVHTFFVFKTTPFFDSGLVTYMYDPLRPLW